MKASARSRAYALSVPVGLAAVGSVAMAAIQVIAGGGVNLAWSGEVAAVFLTFLISFQAGITVAQQTLLNDGLSSRQMKIGSAVGLVALAVAGLADPPRAVGGVLVALGGGLMGLVAGDFNVRLLLPELRTRAQARNALRGAAWLALVVYLRWVGWPSRGLLALLLSGVVAVTVVEAASRLMGWATVDARGRSGGAMLPALLGLGAALIYRNDSSILRIRASRDPTFVDMNLGITGYLLANGIWGLLVGSLLLPEVRADGLALARAIRWTKRAIPPAFGTSTPLALASLAAEGSARSALAITSSVPVALVVTLASVCLHVAGRSIWIYGVASCSVGLLLVIPHDLLMYGLLATNVIQLSAFWALLRPGHLAAYTK